MQLVFITDISKGIKVENREANESCLVEDT
jgi:hypothetical protein